MQNLRDKLLKAGAINKKQARKARTEARKDQKKRKDGRKVDAGRVREQQQRERFETRQAAEREEVQRRQAELNREAEQRAQEARIQDLMQRHKVRARPEKNLKERPFHYVGPDRRIRRIHVGLEQALGLASGDLALVDSAAGTEEYMLVDAAGAKRIEELAPERILFWSREEEGELPSYGSGS